MRKRDRGRTNPAGLLRTAVEATERELITAALVNRSHRQAAAYLGVSLRTLFYKKRQLGIGEVAGVYPLADLGHFELREDFQGYPTNAALGLLPGAMPEGAGRP
jgi:hypothetical protein